ncbi:hypothetical protein KFL_000570080 [Klebsormidium nitens]|uniref:Uncharacterized protein n=1 Tax=Klebsormidium nitens TaxID=105231 RepID=A0A0U9HKD6_KLENI|nr:hypothetical protein KFL_000570080 [Klebsormidium nitens]|eukprot:GAQ80559.1 hypothetical protein KFL_000570080 [Klebsormidium nitens]
MDLLSWDHHEEHENLEPAPEVSSSGSEASVISKRKKAAGRPREKAANADEDTSSGPPSPPPKRLGGQLAAALPVLSDIAELYEASQAHKRANQEAIQQLLAQIHSLQRQLLQPLQGKAPLGRFNPHHPRH